MVNVPTSLNNLKSKLDEIVVGKLKSAPIDLKKISNIIDKKKLLETQIWLAKYKRK